MRRTAFAIIIMALMLFISCDYKSKTQDKHDSEESTEQVEDSAFYGVGGIGTSMHSLMLINDAGDTLVFEVIPEGETAELDEPDMIGMATMPTQVVGGMPNAGDRVSVVAVGDGDERVAHSIVNLTSLQGHWQSIERDFEICEGGVVKQSNQSEKTPWTEWKMLNGQLLLGTDTFNIDVISPDSLLLENQKGIYAYTRK